MRLAYIAFLVYLAVTDLSILSQSSKFVEKCILWDVERATRKLFLAVVKTFCCYLNWWSGRAKLEWSAD